MRAVVAEDDPGTLAMVAEAAIFAATGSVFAVVYGLLAQVACPGAAARCRPANPGTRGARRQAMLMPSVSRYMTSNPYTIERGATFVDARKLMHDHTVRHLPVLDRGELCGIVCLRDLALYEAGGADPAASRVDLVMIDATFIVTSDAPLDEVAEIMAEHKYGSVVVMGRDGVEGIFTAVDACKALAHVLQQATLDLA